MPGTLTFPINDDFKAMVAQAVKSKAKLAFVKDQGVYLMAFGKSASSNRVCYAKGFNPRIDDFDAWWDKAQRICGDDFAERLETGIFERAISRGASKVKIKLTARSISVECS